MYIYQLFLLTIFSYYAEANRSLRHVHSQQLVKHKKLEPQKARKNEFFLRCPKMSLTGEKLFINVAWVHNDQTVFSVISGKVVQLFNGNVTVKRWQTLDGKLNILANTSRWKFEYEEKRGWFVLKIREPSVEDDGLWKCRMVVWFGNSGVARRYESRKRINLKNKSDYFTFKKRNLSDTNERHDWDSPVTFTKPNADYTVFSRMSKFNSVNYIRNGDLIDKSENIPTQVGFLLQSEDDVSNSLLMRNYSSVHALPTTNFGNSRPSLFYLLVLCALINRLINF